MATGRRAQGEFFLALFLKICFCGFWAWVFSVWVSGTGSTDEALEDSEHVTVGRAH